VAKSHSPTLIIGWRSDGVDHYCLKHPFRDSEWGKVEKPLVVRWRMGERSVYEDIENT
jgi:hypothetical protein